MYGCCCCCFLTVSYVVFCLVPSAAARFWTISSVQSTCIYIAFSLDLKFENCEFQIFYTNREKELNQIQEVTGNATKTKTKLCILHMTIEMNTRAVASKKLVEKRNDNCIAVGKFN